MHFAIHVTGAVIDGIGAGETIAESKANATLDAAYGRGVDCDKLGGGTMPCTPALYAKLARDAVRRVECIINGRIADIFV